MASLEFGAAKLRAFLDFASLPPGITVPSSLGTVMASLEFTLTSMDLFMEYQSSSLNEYG